VKQLWIPHILKLYISDNNARMIIVRSRMISLLDEQLDNAIAELGLEHVQMLSGKSTKKQ